MQKLQEKELDESERTILRCHVCTKDKGNTSMLLILADQDMLERAVALWNGQPLFMDTTCAIVRYKLSCLTVLALDEAGDGEPVCGATPLPWRWLQGGGAASPRWLLLAGVGRSCIFFFCSSCLDRRHALISTVVPERTEQIFRLARHR